MDTYLSKFAEGALISAPVFSQVLPFTSGIPSHFAHQKPFKSKISFILYVFFSQVQCKECIFNIFVITDK